MRVFVTGATGFVMGAVTRALRSRGDAVVALVRSPSRAAPLTALGCELVAGDVVDPTDALDAVRGCDALIHGAAIYEIGVGPERRRAMEETNVTGTRRILDLARTAETPRVVYVSTIAAFGNTHGAVVAEGHRPTSPPTSAYEDTKRRAHDIAVEAARSGVRVVIVQPGQVYGPNDHSTVGANLLALARGNLRYRAFEGLGLNLVHVDDLADGILRALDRGHAGECYVLGGEITTLGAAYRAVAKVTGRALPPVVLPSAIARIAGLLIPSMREVVSSADGVTFWATDAKARDELKTNPRDLATGMKDVFGPSSRGRQGLTAQRDPRPYREAAGEGRGRSVVEGGTREHGRPCRPRLVPKVSRRASAQRLVWEDAGVTPPAESRSSSARGGTDARRSRARCVSRSPRGAMDRSRLSRRRSAHRNRRTDTGSRRNAPVCTITDDRPKVSTLQPQKW